MIETREKIDASQLDLALHFGGRPQHAVAVEWESTGDDLAPTLSGALATLRCVPWQSYDGGDHRLHLGRVEEIDLRSEGVPLLFDRGSFSAASQSVRSTLSWLA